MTPLDEIARACAVIVDTDAGGDAFRHLATAWSVGEGDWVTVWTDELAPPSSARLILAHSGADAAIEGWEQDEDGSLAGFRSVAAATSLRQAEPGALAKRCPLQALGYPSVIDHPQFALHRPSLSVERYFPYLCPWLVEGHCCLFTASEGYLTGAFYHGMAGGPVLDAHGAVVGVLLDGCDGAGQLPLARFARLA